MTFITCVCLLSRLASNICRCAVLSCTSVAVDFYIMYNILMDLLLYCLCMIVTASPTGERSVVMTVSVCPSVCEHACLWNYTVSQKNDKLLPITYQILTDFQNSFAVRLTEKFATNSCLNISPRLKHVATLPCEICMSKNGISLKYVL